MKKKETTGVALFDIHFPHQSNKALNAVFDFIKDTKPDILVLGGDQLDMDLVSHWTVDELKKKEGRRLKQDYDQFDEQILKKLEGLSKWEEKVFIFGNHTDFIAQYLNKNPVFEGLLEPDNYLKLKERKWKTVPLNRSYSIGKLAITHGLYVNMYHAKKTLETWGESNCVFYGHKHDIQTHSAVYRGGDGQPRMAQSCGCLCEMNPDYMRGKPNAWVHGFLSFTVRPDGKFTAVVYPIINGVFSVGRKTYGLKKEV